MIHPNFKRAVVIAVATSPLSIVYAVGDAPNYGAIDVPLTQAERSFVERSISTLGLDHPGVLASTATKARPSSSSLWIARVKDPALCTERNCLTLLIEGKAEAYWTVRAMLYAGNLLTQAEPTDEPFGSGVLVFSTGHASRQGSITATKTPLGWLIR